jgi:hypothetical protein
MGRLLLRGLSIFLILVAIAWSNTPARAADGDMFIRFMARPTAPIAQGSPGHAFFCIILHLTAGIREDCFGFYPENLSKIFDGPGKLSNEFKKDSIQNVSITLEHKISEDTRKGIYDVLHRWAGQSYQLRVNNCMDLTIAVAERAGLRTPPRPRSTITLPTELLEGLKRLYWMGQWQSTEPQSRFQLDISASNKVGWAERNQSGAVLEIEVPLSPAEGEVRIERPNTARVMDHLGFQPTIRQQILAAGPRPSFLTMRRVDHRIEAQWNGLVVIKDEQAQLKELKQPGTTSPKPYTFDRIS